MKSDSVTYTEEKLWLKSGGVGYKFFQPATDLECLVTADSICILIHSPNYEDPSKSWSSLAVFKLEDLITLGQGCPSAPYAPLEGYSETFPPASDHVRPYNALMLDAVSADPRSSPLTQRQQIALQWVEMIARAPALCDYFKAQVVPMVSGMSPLEDAEVHKALRTLDLLLQRPTHDHGVAPIMTAHYVYRHPLHVLEAGSSHACIHVDSAGSWRMTGAAAPSTPSWLDKIWTKRHETTVALATDAERVALAPLPAAMLRIDTTPVGVDARDWGCDAPSAAVSPANAARTPVSAVTPTHGGA